MGLDASGTGECLGMGCFPAILKVSHNAIKCAVLLYWEENPVVFLPLVDGSLFAMASGRCSLQAE